MKSIKYLLSFILFFSLYPFVFSQDLRSLSQRYKEIYTENSTDIAAIIELRTIYAENQFDSLFSLGKYITQRGIDNDNSSLLNMGKLITAQFLSAQGKSEFSNSLLLECLAYYKKKGDLERVADVQNQLGIANIYSNKYNDAAAWFLKSVKTSEQLGRDNTSFVAQMNLCEVYYREEKYDLAEAEILEYIEKTKRLNLRLALKKGYDYLGKIHLAKGNTELGIEYYNKALNLALKFDSKKARAIAYNNIAIAYFEMGDYDIALENFKKGLNYRLEINEENDIAESYYNIANWYYFQNKYLQAIEYYKTSISVAEKSNNIEGLRDAYEGIAESYLLTKNYKAAYESQQKYIEAITEIHKRNQQSNLGYLRAAYELQREENRLEQSKREKIISESLLTEQNRGKIIVVVFSILIGILLIFYFFLIGRNHKKEQEKEPKKKKTTDQDIHKLRESKWNKMEYFIENTSIPHMQHIKIPGNTIHLFQNCFVIPVHARKIFFWQCKVSKLENFLFYNFLSERILPDSSDQEIITWANSQNLINFETACYGFIETDEKGGNIYGEKGLILKSKKQIAFLSENRIRLSRCSIIVSDQLKNDLIERNIWDKLVEQIEILENTSEEMRQSIINDVWGNYLKECNGGIIMVNTDPMINSAYTDKSDQI